MKKVQEELDEVIGINNVAEESHLPKLQYLDAVVKETLRIHTIAPLLVPKSPSQSCTIGGFTVPKGCRVWLNMWSVHMDSDYWENPDEFMPERFLNEPGKFDCIGNNFHYLPFGSGRRVCPGILLAERMIMNLLAMLLHSFLWKLADGEKLDVSEKFGLVVRKKTSLLVIPAPRLLDFKLYD